MTTSSSFTVSRCSTGSVIDCIVHPLPEHWMLRPVVLECAGSFCILEPAYELDARVVAITGPNRPAECPAYFSFHSTPVFDTLDEALVAARILDLLWIEDANHARLADMAAESNELRGYPSHQFVAPQSKPEPERSIFDEISTYMAGLV